MCRVVGGGGATGTRLYTDTIDFHNFLYVVGFIEIDLSKLYGKVSIDVILIVSSTGHA